MCIYIYLSVVFVGIKHKKFTQRHEVTTSSTFFFSLPTQLFLFA